MYLVSMGHHVHAAEVGPRVWDLHCLDCDWQAWTWTGEGAAQEMADRHIRAVRKAATAGVTDKDLITGDWERDLVGFRGPGAPPLPHRFGLSKAREDG